MPKRNRKLTPQNKEPPIPRALLHEPVAPVPDIPAWHTALDRYGDAPSLPPREQRWYGEALAQCAKSEKVAGAVYEALGQALGKSRDSPLTYGERRMPDPTRDLLLFRMHYGRWPHDERS